MFEELTRYIPELEKADSHFGEWIHDLDENGLPRSFSYVRYIKPVYDIHEALFQFYAEHPEYEMKDFLDIIKGNGISTDYHSVCETDCTEKDAQSMIAMLYLASYSEKWYTGALLHPTDDYGRTLAYVYLDDGSTMIQEELLRAGYATTMKIQSNTKYAVRFDKDEQEAQSNQVGLWKGGT